jgi:hypothetical protein
MNRILYFLVLICFLFTVASAQSPAKILKQAEKALGGTRVLQNIRSRQKIGTIRNIKDDSKGAFTMQTAQPNFYNESFDLNGFETESGFNGNSGWARDSREGLRTLTGISSRDFQVEANFRSNLWLNYKKEKSKIVSCERSEIKGKPANCLSLNTVKGVSIKLFFDTASGLLLREEIPAGDLLKITEYSDYRAAGGVMEAFTINVRVGEDAYEIKLEKIIHNAQIAKTDFDFPRLSGEPLPDIPSLLKELQFNEDKTEAILENYSYTQKVVTREPGKDGVLREKESEIYQLSFYKGNRIRRLVEKDGKPLSEKDQREEDERVQKEVADIEKKIARNESKGEASNEDDRRLSVAEVLRASLLKNPRRERFRGRDVVVFDFEPNPDFDMKNAKSILKFFGKVGGVMWIDEKDKQVARMEASLLDSFKIGGGLLANLKKGATLTIEQERVNDEIWLPSMTDINISARVFLVKGLTLNQTVRSYNYQKFRTEVTGSKVDDVKKPQ